MIFKRIICCFLITFSSAMIAQPSPAGMLENISQRIIATLKQHQGHLQSNHAVINKVIRAELLPHVDVQGMSRSVLGRAAWLSATAAEKIAFTQAFTALVIRTYAGPLAEYSGETVKFLPMRGSLDNRFLRVNSIISRSNGQQIPLSYHVVFQHDEWKIYDFSVEGVSLLQSFRSQFGSMMQHEPLQAVIEHLNKRTAAS